MSGSLRDTTRVSGHPGVRQNILSETSQHTPSTRRVCTAPPLSGRALTLLPSTALRGSQDAAAALYRATRRVRATTRPTCTSTSTTQIPLAIPPTCSGCVGARLPVCAADPRCTGPTAVDDRRTGAGLRSVQPTRADRVNIQVIEDNWDEVLRLAASIRHGTVSAALIMRELTDLDLARIGASPEVTARCPFPGSVRNYWVIVKANRRAGILLPG